MKNLSRAFRLALNYKYSLISSIICAMLVAILWGANIGAVYPFVEVVFQGKSIHQWVDDRVKDAEKSQDNLQQEIDALNREIALAAPADVKDLEQKVAFKENQKAAAGKSAERYASMRPYVKKYLPDDPFMALVLLVVFLLVGTLLKGIFLLANMVLVARVGERSVLDLQNSIFRNTLQRDLQSLGENGTGDLISRIRGETSAIGTAITTLFGKTLREPLKMMACLIGAALINWRLLLFSLIIVPIAGYLTIRLAKSMKRASRRAMEESAKLMNRLFQALTYVKVVKAYTMEGHERSRFRVVAKDVYRKGMKIAVYSSLFRVNNELLGIGIICLSVLAGGYLVLNQETHLLNIKMCTNPMTFGHIMAFYAFLIGVADPIRKMADVYAVLQSGMVAADRVFPLLDRQASIVSPEKPQAIPTEAASLRMDQVHFHYVAGNPVLQDINFELRAGEALAIVGANGSGKSTLVNLLPRFYDATQGDVYLDNTRLQEFRLKDLRKYIGLVTQQTMLFDDSIMNNVRYGSPGASDEQVMQAAKQAHAHSFIVSQLEDGYQTMIGEHGGRLSGGQLQRISLARAILRDPKLLILDEATSQIDPESELLIHQSLVQFMKNRTTIMITHRMSTLDLADRILVLDEGRIADLGTHDELIGRCEIYQRLRHKQLKESA